MLPGSQEQSSTCRHPNAAFGVCMKTDWSACPSLQQRHKYERLRLVRVAPSHACTTLKAFYTARPAWQVFVEASIDAV